MNIKFFYPFFASGTLRLPSAHTLLHRQFSAQMVAAKLATLLSVIQFPVLLNSTIILILIRRACVLCPEVMAEEERRRGRAQTAQSWGMESSSPRENGHRRIFSQYYP